MWLIQAWAIIAASWMILPFILIIWGRSTMRVFRGVLRLTLFNRAVNLVCGRSLPCRGRCSSVKPTISIWRQTRRLILTSRVLKINLDNLLTNRRALSKRYAWTKSQNYCNKVQKSLMKYLRLVLRSRRWWRGICLRRGWRRGIGVRWIWVGCLRGWIECTLIV